MYFFFYSLLSSCSSFRDSQYGSGNVHANSNHDLESHLHGNNTNIDDTSYLNGTFWSIFVTRWFWASFSFCFSIIIFLLLLVGATKESHFKSNRGDSESDILEQTPDTDDSGPHSCPGEWTNKHSNNSIKNIHPHKVKKIHKVTNPTIKESSALTNSQKVSVFVSNFHNQSDRCVIFSKI